MFYILSDLVSSWQKFMNNPGLQGDSLESLEDGSNSGGKEIWQGELSFPR